jgi:hypothetical protein
VPKQEKKTAQTGPRPSTTRVFKAIKFAKEAAKRKISDNELCAAISEIQASPKTYSLGGEVYKKRLNDNMDRSIVLAKGGVHWFYAHLFQKKNQDNISDNELDAFKEAAKVLGKLSGAELDAAVKAGKFQEICHDCKTDKGEQDESKRAQAPK